VRGFPDIGDPAGFDDEDAFVPEHLPEPGPFLEGHEVLVGDDHLAFHRTARDCFEERGVYDMTFGYNLARLNRDQRHPNAGFRYAVETADAGGDGVVSRLDVAAPAVLRAEFTPTTPFCPQSDTLTVGSFRAWNGLADRHDYDIVRVRVHPMHQGSGGINSKLARLEERFVETGALGAIADPGRTNTSGFDGVDHGDPAEDRHV